MIKIFAAIGCCAEPHLTIIIRCKVSTIFSVAVNLINERASVTSFTTMQQEVLFFLLIGFCVTQGKLSELILLPEAARKDGAVCLDGSPPGFFYREGMHEELYI